jgi:hypothetical protein
MRAARCLARMSIGLRVIGFADGVQALTLRQGF